jgi:hypothetical protein
MSVGYSRLTRRSPSSMTSGLAASSSCRWASTPSFDRPGSKPSSWATSLWTSVMVITSVSPFGLRTVQVSPSSVRVQGHVIQFSGL